MVFDDIPTLLEGAVRPAILGGEEVNSGGEKISACGVQLTESGEKSRGCGGN